MLTRGQWTYALRRSLDRLPQPFELIDAVINLGQQLSRLQSEPRQLLPPLCPPLCLLLSLLLMILVKRVLPRTNVRCGSLRATGSTLFPPPLGIQNMLGMLAESPHDFPLLLIDVKHDVELFHDVFDLALELALRADIEKGHVQF